MDNLQSHYRINVAKKDFSNTDKVGYTHYFAIDVIHRDKAIEILIDMNKHYSGPEFEISVTFWNISGSIKHDRQFGKDMLES